MDRLKGRRGPTIFWRKSQDYRDPLSPLRGHAWARSLDPLPHARPRASIVTVLRAAVAGIPFVALRFEGVSLFWRLDLELLAEPDRSSAALDDLEGPSDAAEWSWAESALANGVATAKAHLRGNTSDVEDQLLARAFPRLGQKPADTDLKARLLTLADKAAQADTALIDLANRFRNLVRASL